MSNKFDDLPIVLQLQHLAMSQNSDIEELLRKTLAVSLKLGLKDMATWCQSELNGYPNEESVPAYRVLQGRLDTKYNYSVLMQIKDGLSEEEIRILTRKRVTNSVFEIQQLAKRKISGERYEFNIEDIILIINAVGNIDYRDITNFISTLNFGGIISKIQTKILELTCELEKANILGDSEPTRLFRRQFILSHATLAGSSSWR